MKLIDILTEAETNADGSPLSADQVRLRTSKAAKLQAAQSHTSPINISQARWDMLVRKYGIDAAREEDQHEEGKERSRDFGMQYNKDQAYNRSVNQLNQGGAVKSSVGTYNDKEAQIAKQERDAGASLVNGYGKARASGGQIDPTQAPGAQQQAQQSAQQQFKVQSQTAQHQFQQQAANAQQQFKQQALAAQQKLQHQIHQTNQGIPTAPANPAQATNTKWAQQMGFKSIKDFYNDMTTRAASRDPAVRAQADKQLQQYEKNIATDRARMARPQQ